MDRSTQHVSITGFKVTKDCPPKELLVSFSSSVSRLPYIHTHLVPEGIIRRNISPLNCIQLHPIHTFSM